MTKKALKFLLISLIGLMLILASLLSYGYYYGLKALPEDTRPSPQAYPEIALDALWVSLGGYGPRTMKPLYPWQWLRVFYVKSIQNIFPISTRLSNFAAQGLMLRNKQTGQRTISRHVSTISAAIWLSHHWSADQALNTILSETYFGHCYYGINQAAIGYFGKSLSGLKPESIVMLVALTKAPSTYDPWKYPEKSKEETMRLINLLKTNHGNDFKSGDNDLFSELLATATTACNKK
jgi:Transglycosylase